MSYTIDQVGSLISGSVNGDQFGDNISLNNTGNIVAISSVTHDSNKGHVKIYEYANSSWDQLGSDIDGTNNGDHFGTNIALNSYGNIVACGSYHDGVKTLSYDGSNWNLMQKITSSDTQLFGVGLSLNDAGNIVAIGGYSGTTSGLVSVYSWNGSSWDKMGSNILGESTGDSSGSRISLNSQGNIVAIGAYLNDGNGTDSGHVRVHSYNGTSWSQIGSDIDGEAAGDRSGWAIELNNQGNILAIGAHNNDGNGTDSGHVRVHSYDGTSWSQIGSDIDGLHKYNYNGYSLSLNGGGDILAAGKAGTEAEGRGEITLFKYDNNSWNEVGNIVGDNDWDRFGYQTISLNNAGNVVAGTSKTYSQIGNNRGMAEIYSVTAPDTGNNAGASGDPYITTLSGITYKMDDFTGYSRMLQGILDEKLFILNAETKLLTPDEIHQLIHFRNQNMSFEQKKKYKLDNFPAYFTKLFLSWGETKLTIDLKNGDIIENTTNQEYYREYCIEDDYNWTNKSTEVKKTNISIGKINLVIKSYDNIDIKSGFTISNTKFIQNKTGCLVKPMLTEDIKLNTLTSTTLIYDIEAEKPKSIIYQEFYNKNGNINKFYVPIY